MEVRDQTDGEDVGREEGGRTKDGEVEENAWQYQERLLICSS